MLLATGVGLLMDLKNPVRQLAANFKATVESTAVAPVRRAAPLREVRLPGGGDEQHTEQPEGLVQQTSMSNIARLRRWSPTTPT